ncbi:MAG: DUF1902 domain-containing protein [Spirochaetaceae bacterium]|nr:DUF1902 domain-containing protein [Spirochaetaceae bacterium]
MTFWVGARWDDEAEIFRSESNITGLHVEAASLDEFQEILMDLVPELLAANYGGDIHTSKKQNTYPVWNYEYGEQLLQPSH